LTFQYFDYERTWCWLFQKCVKHNTLYIYILEFLECN